MTTMDTPAADAAALALLGTLRDALGQLDDFLDDHDDHALANDLIGLRWALDVNVDLLDGQVLHPLDADAIDEPVVAPG